MDHSVMTKAAKAGTGEIRESGGRQANNGIRVPEMALPLAVQKGHDPVSLRSELNHKTMKTVQEHPGGGPWKPHPSWSVRISQGDSPIQ